MWLCTPYLKTDYKDRLSAPLQCSRKEYNIFLISCQILLRVGMEAFKVIVATFGKTQKPNTIISSEMRTLPALYLLQRDNSIIFFGDCQGFKMKKRLKAHRKKDIDLHILFYLKDNQWGGRPVFFPMLLVCEFYSF